MTREPDRYEAKARELFRSLVMDEARAIPMIAAALRAVEAETLERAAQALDSHRYINASKIVRALASPAAAPAAKVCRAEVASRMPDYSHYECTLPKGHTGAHREGSFAEWTDATTVVAPPSEPAALAPDFFADHSDAEVQAALDDVRGKAPAQGAEARIAELEYALRMTREHALNAGCRGYLGSNFFDRIDAALAARAATVKP